MRTPKKNDATRPMTLCWDVRGDILRLKLITNVYSLHAFGNGAVLEGEKRKNNDGLGTKLNINNIIKVSATANAIENNKWMVRWHSFM